MSKHIGIAPVPSNGDSWGGSVTNPYPGAANETTVASNASQRSATGTFVAGSTTTSVRVDIWGPAGAQTAPSGLTGAGSGGNGGYVSGVLSVSPGETLWLNFNSDGGTGGSVDTYGGTYTALGVGSTVYHPYSTTNNWYTSPAVPGGAGGGSVDVRQGSNDISRIMLVAGAGGGQGGYGSNANTGSESNAVDSASNGGNGGSGGSMYGNNGGPGQWNQVSGGGFNVINGVNNQAGTALGGAGGANTAGGSPGANSTKVISAGQPGTGKPANGNPPHNGGNGAGGSNAGWPGGGGGGGGGGYTGGGGGGGGGGDYYNFSVGRPMASSGAAGGGGAGGTSYVDTSVTGVRMLAGCYTPTSGTIVFTPNPPVVTNVNWPASVVDLAAGQVLNWTFTQPGTATQTKYAICRQVLGGLTHQWWNAGSATWVTSEMFNSGTPTQHTFNPGDWVNGASWQVSVAVIDSNGGVSGYTAAPVVQAETAPTCNITSPAGTVTTANPTISWTEVLGSNCSQVSYAVYVYQSGTPGYEYQSGTVYSQATSISLSSLPTPPYLPNGSYTTELIVTQTGGQTVEDTQTFTVNQPTITAPTGVIYGSSPTDTPAVTCTLQNFVSGSAYSIIQRSINGGSTWTSIRNYVTFAGASTQTIVDYEAPPNTPLMYRAAVQSATAQSAWHNFVNVLTLKPTWFTLSDPLTPGSAMSVSLTSGTFTETGGERQASYDLLGVNTPVILADTLQAVSLQLNLMFFSDVAYQAFKALRATQHTLLFQSATWQQQWYVRLGPALTVNVDLASARAGRNGPVSTSPFLHRDVQLTAQVVATP